MGRINPKVKHTYLEQVFWTYYTPKRHLNNSTFSIVMVNTRTRSGRQVKKPELFKPTETVIEDDYAEDEHDTDIDSDIDTEDEYYSDDESDEDDEDDESLKDFVVDDDEESEEEDA